MCGIFGAVFLDQSSKHKREVENAIGKVYHRGPDGQGAVYDDRVALAHRRLAIIDVHPRSNQPMTFRNQTIVFNGCIYNYQEIREELLLKGYIFQTKSDTEVILAAYHCWQEKCLERFNGMWAFIIYDHKEQCLFGSRDRFGIRPLYYTRRGNQFLFASEIKQFYEINGWSPSLNMTQAYDYLNFGYQNHTRETFFEGIFQILPSSYFKYKIGDDKIEFHSYYDLEQRIENTACDKTSMFKTFDSILSQSVIWRTRSDVALGSSFSGGLDSSAVAIKLTENSKDPIHTFTVDFKEEAYSEKEFVVALNEQYNLVQHLVYPERSDLFNDLDEVTWHQEQPVTSPSVWAQFYLFQAAHAADIKVMLDGQGADEILAGYDKFYITHFKSMVYSNPFKLVPELIGFFRKHRWDWSENLKLYGFYQRKLKRETAPWINFEPNRPSIQRGPENSLKQVSLNLIQQVGLPALLHYEDRNAMAHGIESRLPYLDHELVEFCLALPDHMKIYQGKRKYILREVMKNKLPSSIYNRYDKMGFVTPLEKWLVDHNDEFKNELRESVERIKPLVTNHILQNKYVRAWWRVISFARWMKVFNIDL